jgi:chromosome segregation ATPase
MAHDASVRSEQAFEVDNNELIGLREQAQTEFDNARANKTSFESQIVVLEELKYTVTNQAILEEIDNKIEEFRGEITEAEAVIEDAQVAFNELAERSIVVVATRQAELAEIEKQQRFTDAKAHYDYLQAEIQDYQNRLQYFDEDADAAAGTE